MVDYTEEDEEDNTLEVESGIFKVKLSDLKLHPASLRIYEYKKSKKQVKVLAKTMELIGQLEPITINTDNEIISGTLRFKAALFNGWKDLKAIRVPKTENEEQQIVFHNQQRRKTPKEIINEAEAILGTLGKKQGERRDLLKHDSKNPFGKIGQDRFEIAAKVIGDISASSLRRMMDVVDFEKENEENKQLGLVEKIINNQLSPSRAHSLMKAVIDERKARQERKNTNVEIQNNFSTSDYNLYNKSSVKMEEVKTGSVQVVFTSPPYYNLRNYGNSVQGIPELGHERTPQEYVENLSSFFKEVKRVLKKSGSFFINIGDTFVRGENLLIPNRLIIHLCDKEGWYIVNEIIWKKSNPLPHGVTNRLQPTYEKIFHLVKEPEKYYYEEVKIYNDSKIDIVKGPRDRNTQTTERDEGGFIMTRAHQKFKDFIESQQVEDIIIGPSAQGRQRELKTLNPLSDHPALMPSYLPVIPILTTSKEGDIVLDPFSGSATTGKTALLLGRKYIGYEVNKENYELSISDLNTLKINKIEEASQTEEDFFADL